MISLSTLSISKEIEPEGFEMISTAPYSIAMIVVSAPAFVTLETIITGLGCWDMISFNASSPDIIGISTSIVITSGSNFFTFSIASFPFLAFSITVMLSCFSNISESIFLINAESSTTSTLIIFPPPISSFKRSTFNYYICICGLKLKLKSI